jgi:hypothetical protein
VLLVSAAALLVTPGARADDTSDLESLLDEDVITTASTRAERASAAPATSVTLTAEDLQTYGVRTLAEAINFLGLGLVTSDPLRTPEIGARGVLLSNDDGKHVLLLVNGHAINDPLYGAARFDQGAGVPIGLDDAKGSRIKRTQCRSASKGIKLNRRDTILHPGYEETSRACGCDGTRPIGQLPSRGCAFHQR